MATLYLNPEGILYPRAAILRAGEARVLSENVAIFDGVLAEFPSAKIVLHSWLVYDVGYRQTVSLLSPLVQERIIGATVPGNRLCPFRLSSKPTRREWLRADLKKRQPLHPVLLDTDPGQILPSLSESSLIVCQWVTGCLADAAPDLCQLLRSPELEAYMGAVSSNTYRDGCGQVQIFDEKFRTVGWCNIPAVAIAPQQVG